MKKQLAILLLSSSLILTGCGSSSNDYNQVSGQQNPPIVNPTPATGWIVEVGAGAGSYGDAFGSIQDASNAAAAANNGDQTITVKPGTYTETVTLANGQKLIGTQGNNLPVISGRIILADGNTVSFLRIQDSADDAINGDNRNGATITNCEIINSGGEGIQARPGTGTWIVTGNTITDSFGLGVRLGTETTGQMRALVNDNIITGSGFDAISLIAENSSQLVAQFHGNTMTDNQDFFTFEAIAGNTATLSLDIEDNTNDDTYVLSNANTGSTLNVEELNFGPPANIPSNTGTVTIDDTPGFFSPPTSVADGFCGF